MNYIVVWKELSLFFGNIPKSISTHEHPIIQLVVGVDSPFLWKKEGEWIEMKSLLIAPNEKHECDSNGNVIFTIGIDPNSDLGKWITLKYLKDSPFVEFPEQQMEQLNFKEIQLLISQQKWSKLYLSFENIFDYHPNLVMKNKQDDRVKNVLKYISNNIHSLMNTTSLAEIACLSESRLLFLFKKEMGLPIRNYILWKRVQMAIIKTYEGYNLTEVAHFAGFSDQAHLTRSCVKIIGITPSIIIKNSKFIQVYLPE